MLTVIGLGNLGRLYAGGALKAGRVVCPVNRGDDVVAALARSGPGDPVLVGVGEAALPAVCAALPAERRADAILVQNGLARPRMRELGVGGATLAVVWTLEKPSFARLESLPMGAYGPQATFMREATAAIGLRCATSGIEGSTDAGIDEGTDAAAKHAFILAINALGLVRPITVGEWLESDPARVDAFVAEGARLAGPMLGVQADPTKVAGRARAGMSGFGALPCRGRTALDRVDAARAFAATRGIPTPALDSASD